jgi:hypothetical protein
MKPILGPTAMLAMVLTAAPVLAAAETTKVYKSGILVLAFLAFLALLVVVQLIPSVLMGIGMVVGLLKRRSAAKVVVAQDKA